MSIWLGISVQSVSTASQINGDAEKANQRSKEENRVLGYAPVIIVEVRGSQVGKPAVSNSN